MDNIEHECNIMALTQNTSSNIFIRGFASFFFCSFFDDETVSAVSTLGRVVCDLSRPTIWFYLFAVWHLLRNITPVVSITSYCKLSLDIDKCLG